MLGRLDGLFARGSRLVDTVQCRALLDRLRRRRLDRPLVAQAGARSHDPGAGTRPSPSRPASSSRISTTANPDENRAYSVPSRRGMPTIHSEPSMAPVTDAIPPNTAVTTRLNDSPGPNRRAGIVGEVDQQPAVQESGERGDRARDRERQQLHPSRRLGQAGRRELVVAHGDHRPPGTGEPDPVHHPRGGEHDGEAEPVVGALLVEVDAQELRARELHRRPVSSSVCTNHSW